MKHDMTIGEKYGPAMEITDAGEAARYFEECVQHSMSHGRSREDAENVELQNLGYYAGYYGNETRSRVERLYACSHPVFGKIAENGSPTPELALQAGLDAARKRA